MKYGIRKTPKERAIITIYYECEQYYYLCRSLSLDKSKTKVCYSGNTLDYVAVPCLNGSEDTESM